jgi:hypothetical protein
MHPATMHPAMLKFVEHDGRSLLSLPGFAQRSGLHAERAQA